MNDLKFAFRRLGKQPGTNLMIVLILALGIGGTAAVFSIADKVLLNPIPGHDSRRLVTVQEVNRMGGSHWQVSPPLIQELAGYSNVIESLTYYHQAPEEKKMRVDSRMVTLRGAAVAPDFFEFFKLRPQAGRTFLPAEGGIEAGKTILLSHGVWQQHFGGDPEIIGDGVRLDDQVYSVVGVMPPGFQFPFGEDSQFWIPRSFTREELDSDWAAINRMWSTIMKVRAGVTLPELQSALDVIASRRAPSVNEGSQRWAIEAEPARQSFTNERLQKTVWCLLATLAALLVIAGVNAGNLLLARAISRQGEFGIRMALGAGRLRIARQTLVESLLLAGMAAVAATFVAWGGIVALEQFYLSGLPRLQAIGLDGKVLGIICLISTSVGLLFGAAPAWVAARIDLSHSLKESSGRHSGGVLQRLFHDGLVVIQVCLAVVLVTGAWLMVFSVVKLLRIDPGLEARGLYRIQYDAFDFANQPAYDVEAAMKRGVPKAEAFKEQFRAQVERGATFQRLALQRLHATPGVESAAVNRGVGFFEFEFESRADPVRLGCARVGVVDGDYLRTVGAKLIAGRLLGKEDAMPGQQAVVINERMAAACWPGENSLGQRFMDRERNRAYVVVGVIKNIEDWTLDAEVKPVFYLPYERDTEVLGGIGDFTVRSSTDAGFLREALAQTGKELMAPMEIREFYSIETRLHQSTAPRRVMMWLLVSLGGLGLLLSALGVYAVLAYAVASRTREIGIRMALGAGRGQVRNLFLRHGARLMLNGMILGVVLAIVAAHYVEALWYGVTPADPRITGAVLAVLGFAGTIACWLPAQRAANVNPMDALRYE